MTNSFFLVHVIDKNNDNDISLLHNFPDELVTKGRTHFQDDTIYIQGIEPQPEFTINFSGGGIGMDSNSIWLGINIIEKPTFEENVELFHKLSDWIRDFLFLLRFILNLNLKAKVYFHIEYNREMHPAPKLSFQKTIDLNCDSGSNFRMEYNRYELVIPFLKRLLQYKPTDKLRALMYNNASGKAGSSIIIDYFYSFATLEGIINNWADANGYSELWGSAVADLDEQERIHGDLRSHFNQFIRNQDINTDKLNQLQSFKDSTFPTDRKIRRTLYRRFRSYYTNRLTTELQENERIRAMLNTFHRIYSRRNEIGHSLERYTQSPGFTEDINTLMSTIKILMDFELNNFLNDELDWKFEIRLNNLRDNLRPITHGNVLEKFTYNILPQNQISSQIKDRFGTRAIENVEFQSGMVNIDDDGEDIASTNLKFSQRLKLILPLDFQFRDVTHLEPEIFTIYDDPYWWIITTYEDSHFIFKTFPPNKITTTSNEEKFCEIPSKSILLVIKLDFLNIPEDLDIF